MSEPQSTDLSNYSPELRHLAQWENLPDSALPILASIHESNEQAIQLTWNELPASAQNILDNFEQFHALISVSQTFSSLDCLQEFTSMTLPEHLNEEEQEAYRHQLLEQVLSRCVKDIVKQLKKARRDPILKRDFLALFSSQTTTE